MTKIRFFTITPLFFTVLTLLGCTRSSYDVWEDTKTCGRHVSRGYKCLGGNYNRSRAVCSPDEFYCEDDFYVSDGPGEDFIPLMDDARPYQPVAQERAMPQPKETPGEAGSSIPGIESFSDPSLDTATAKVFHNIHFDYDSSYVKGDDNLAVVRNIAHYLNEHPNVYVFIEGHCDEKGPEAYNLALGSRRAHAVRNMLLQQGVHPDHIFTISYGKERPLVFDHHEEAWSVNRRAEFKIYSR
jgi:peptidoglycan-associated lipoprotein